MSDSGRTLGDCRHVRDPEWCVDCLRARVRELEDAIGVCVPTVLRCFIKTAESSLDRDVATKTLARIDAAMARRLSV